MKHVSAITAAIVFGISSAAMAQQQQLMPDSQSPMPNAPPPSGPAQGGPKEPLENSTATSIPSKFAHQVAASDAFEVQAGKLAQQKSKNDQIRAFGAMMVTDHTASTNQLFDAMAAGKLEPSLPSMPDEQHRKAFHKLKGLSGENFDQAYVRTQIQGHQMMEKLLQAYSQTGSNTALRAFAAKALPTVQMHLQKAQQIGQQIHIS
ncbi:MAG TPA: DUF4142 domain-containing protein [Magnetospirillaceae bacterium]|jgi:putative membrane protein